MITPFTESDFNKIAKVVREDIVLEMDTPFEQPTVLCHTTCCLAGAIVLALSPEKVSTEALEAMEDKAAVAYGDKDPEDIWLYIENEACTLLGVNSTEYVRLKSFYLPYYWPIEQRDAFENADQPMKKEMVLAFFRDELTGLGVLAPTVDDDPLDD